MTAGGPLEGYRVVEAGGIGPVPFCGLILADLGADVVRIERPRPPAGREGPGDTALDSGKRRLGLDLKSPAGRDAFLDLLPSCDALLEGFRPGTMERLGLGPKACHAANPRLVYGRMTGYGQDGPLADVPGHDINYIALTGLLHAIGRPGEPPVPPLNLVGDFGGGAMFLLTGVLAALLARERHGRGAVIDAAMTEGAARLATGHYRRLAADPRLAERGVNLLDGGAPFYAAYETADGRYLAVGALEGHFFADLARRIGLEPRFVAGQADRSLWPQMRAAMAEIFRTRTRAAWCELLEGTDACVSPVLDLKEAPDHPHARARGAFVERDGVRSPAPAPRIRFV